MREQEQQQLRRRHTCTPTNASLVRSTVASDLNREETLSDRGLKTLPNNLEENQHQQTGGLKAVVFVLNKNKKPLMPCKPAKARHLLKDKKAVVVTSKPFTIRLLFDCDNKTQPVTLGIDSGYSKVGFSATTNSSQELIAGEVELRSDVSKKISERRMYRRNRRSRLWHRKPRFSNRTSKKKQGWLAPSLRHKIEAHKRLVNKIRSIVPVTKVVVEVAQFDTQKLQNADVEGVDYQNGQTKGYDNLRAFILYRDGHTCQVCNKKGGVFDIHHIIQRKDGGSNRPDNLVCVHTSCHQKLHNGSVKKCFEKPRSFKETALMNNLRNHLVRELGCSYTFGYLTKRQRLEMGLSKSHANDAYVISGASSHRFSHRFETKLRRRNNRSLQNNRKGFKPSVRSRKYPIQPLDVVEYEGRRYLSKGTHCKGQSIIVVKDDGSKKSVSKNKVRLVRYGQGIVLSARQSLTSLSEGVSMPQTIR